MAAKGHLKSPTIVLIDISATRLPINSLLAVAAPLNYLRDVTTCLSQ